jgi:hypothetical protein
MVHDDIGSGHIKAKLHDGGSSCRNHGGLDIMLVRFHPTFRVDGVENFANDVERGDEIGPAVSNEETHLLTDLCDDRVVAGHRAYGSVKDHVVRDLGEGLFHAEGLETSLAVGAFGVKFGLHHVEFFVHFRESADRLDENEPVHAVGYVHANRGGGAVVEVEARVQRLEGEDRDVSRGGERGCRTTAGSGHRVQVDVVWHLAVWMIHEMKLHFVVLTDAHELSGDAPAERPEGVVNSIRHPFHDFHDFEFDRNLGRVVAGDRWRDIRCVG